MKTLTLHFRQTLIVRSFLSVSNLSMISPRFSHLLQLPPSVLYFLATIQAPFLMLPPGFRGARSEGASSGGESSGPGAGDAGPARARPAPVAAGPFRSRAADATTAEGGAGRARRGHLLPPHHRQHAHGEAALRHVQELNGAEGGVRWRERRCSNCGGERSAGRGGC